MNNNANIEAVDTAANQRAIALDRAHKQRMKNAKFETVYEARDSYRPTGGGKVIRKIVEIKVYPPARSGGKSVRKSRIVAEYWKPGSTSHGGTWKERRAASKEAKVKIKAAGLV